MIYVGCAGWSIRREHKTSFSAEGSHLERYSKRLNCVEINSSFYKSHKSQTYAKWQAMVDETFRFSVKLERSITHEHGLHNCEALLDKFLEEVQMLGPRLGPILVQLPPKLMFEPGVVKAFFTEFRRRYSGPIVCEPRHRTWFTSSVLLELAAWRVGLVAADPAIHPSGLVPGADLHAIYYRMHGHPKMYESNYEDDELESLRATLLEQQTAYPGSEIWCIFDNTALGYAIDNALDLSRRLEIESLSQISYDQSVIAPDGFISS